MTLLSGFAMMRNASKLYFPAVESVRSALPIVDEFVIALGQGDPDDDTEQRLRALGDPRIRIIPRRWDTALYRGGSIFASETTFALEQCRSTWCLYLQADEVLHEDDLPRIRFWCERYRDDPRVEGFLFDYYHFWGDYHHHLDTHGVHRREIRVVRNGLGIYSYLDAVSFRRPPDRKLRVVRVPARVYHYGYVRPPGLMTVKKRIQHAIHEGHELGVGDAAHAQPAAFRYGPLGELPRFTRSHPSVMRDFIARFSWGDQLDQGKRKRGDPVTHKHERLKNRFLSWFERRFTDNAELFGWKNYRLVRPSRPARAPAVSTPQAQGAPEPVPGLVVVPAHLPAEDRHPGPVGHGEPPDMERIRPR
jgi:hypothetical protein